MLGDCEFKLFSSSSTTRSRLTVCECRSYEKNLMLLVQAFDQLLQTNPTEALRPCLVFVGDGPARGALEELCATKGIDAVFEGHLSGEELAEAYASADVFAYVSSWS